MRCNSERGQALILVAAALGIFLLGAVGLAVDVGQMYGHRQMAQSAADAAALAGIMSIFDGTNTGANAFGDGDFTCDPGTDARTPCHYARLNGFGREARDTVLVEFPETIPGVQLSTVDDPNLIRVTITRTLPTTFMRFFGPTSSDVKVTAVAAIVDVINPIPILVTHPTKEGSFYIGGDPDVEVTGGPARSIQVNSSHPRSIEVNGNAHLVDLTRAGPDGTGGEFGDWGGPNPFPGNLDPAERYVQPASPILDPLKDIPVPELPAAAPSKTPLPDGTSGCPAVPEKPCSLYYPGAYPTGISVHNETAIFSPGIYYIQSGGFVGHAHGNMYMCAGCAADPVTGTGMMVYNTGGGRIVVGANAEADLQGPPLTSIYKDILFFNDRNAPPPNQPHRIGGGGRVNVVGTIYINNSLEALAADPTRYQTLEVWGGGGSNTTLDGMIITNVLRLGGTSEIHMNLNPAYRLNIRQVALVR